MRPLRLELDGFTSFRQRQEVTFGESLFVISGPTGSGKSSLLDAISFALYGKPARAGVDHKELISLGLPALHVLFEFEAAGRRYRVTRTATRKVVGSALLEDSETGKPLAANATPVTAEIVRILGFDHEIFTRCVLLPQGQFARFLTGTASEKERVLSDLIGLDFYKLMKGRAEAKAQFALGQAQANHQTAASLTATVEDIASARASAAGARARVTSGDKLLATLKPEIEQWREHRRRSAAAQADAAELRRLSQGFERQVNALQKIAGGLDAAVASLKLADEACTRTQTALERAQEANAKAEAVHGGVQTLTETLEALVRLAHSKARRQEAQEDVGQAQARSAELSDKAGRAQAESDAAAAAYQEISSAFQAAVLTRDLQIGDACPVCGGVLAALPAVHGRDEVDAANEARKKTMAARDAALALMNGAVARVDASRHAHGQAELECQAAETELQIRVGTVNEGLENDLKARRARLEELRLASQQRQLEHNAATIALSQAQRLQHSESERANGIRIELGKVVVVATRLASEAEVTPSAGVPAASQLEAWCREWSDWFPARSAAIARSVQRDIEETTRLETQVGDSIVAWGSFTIPIEEVEPRLAGQLEGLREQAEALDKQARELERQVAERERLLGDAAVQQAQGQTYEDLRTELLPARFPKFVLAQALELLAVHASERLFALSGRYRLRTKNADFTVVDTWAADEERDVNTLSGGETFQASLALALALSEEVLTISADQKTRLESLFIDEGFGSLDRESLDAAINTLELLQSQSDRTVGVISHVLELAERLPHIDVIKAQDSSRIATQDVLIDLPPPVQRKPRVVARSEAQVDGAPRLFQLPPAG